VNTVWGCIGSAIAFFLVFFGPPVSAAQPSAAEQSGLTKNQREKGVISNPIGPGTRYFMWEPSYTDRRGSNSSRLLLRLHVTYEDLLIPGIEVDGFYSVLRIEIPLLSVNGVPPRDVAGLGDVGGFDIVALRRPWGQVGVGGAFVFPSATSPLLGSGKFQVGPAAAVFVTRFDPFHFGLLVRDFVSFAASPSRPSLHYISVEPLLVLLPSATYFLLSMPVMVFDWKRAGLTSVPVNLGFGRFFDPGLAMYVQPEYVIAGSPLHALTVKLNISWSW
jgi:hypothetical protein